VEVPALSEEDFARAAPGESSGPVRERVARTCTRQLERQGALNARLLGVEIAQRARPDAKALRLLREAASRMALSARAHDRVLKVARTIADLEAAARVGERHVAEALRYRGIAAPSALAPAIA
jgi:magnesium chelatase family protein